MLGLGWLFPSPEKRAAKQMRSYVQAVWEAGGPQRYVPWALHTLRRDLKEKSLVQVDMLAFDQHQPRIAALMLLAEVKARYGLTGGLSTADVETLQGDGDYWAAHGLYFEADRIVTEAELKALHLETYDNARAALLALVDEPSPDTERTHPIDRLLSERRAVSEKGWANYCLSPDNGLNALFGQYQH